MHYGLITVNLQHVLPFPINRFPVRDISVIYIYDIDSLIGLWLLVRNPSDVKKSHIPFGVRADFFLSKSTLEQQRQHDLKCDSTVIDIKIPYMVRTLVILHSMLLLC